jgi:hypothetical protein
MPIVHRCDPESELVSVELIAAIRMEMVERGPANSSAL